MKILLFGVWLTFSGDAATTHYALTHGGKEIVMPTQKPWVIDATVGAEAALSTTGILWLDKNHPKAAKVIGWSMVAVRGAVVVHNVEQLRKR
jgi:hypothetical protein